VRLGLEDEGAMVAFSVEDDGPGVPAQYHDKVFEMFRTLKPRDQVEGSGMGLAMVRKNVEIFGGTVTLHSSQGCGAKFQFTWPKTQPPMATA
jgi:signal transduction histidine kinase